MDEQTRQLSELIGDIIYNFGAYDINSDCCENISHGEYRALRTVSRFGKCSMQDIAKNIAVTKSGATRIVGRLEEKKLVRRINDQNDGRVCCVQLSKEGNMLMSRINEEPAKRMNAILSAMDPDMRQILLIGLRNFFQTALNQNASGKKQQKSVEAPAQN